MAVNKRVETTTKWFMFRWAQPFWGWVCIENGVCKLFTPRGSPIIDHSITPNIIYSEPQNWPSIPGEPEIVRKWRVEHFDLTTQNYEV